MDFLGIFKVANNARPSLMYRRAVLAAAQHPIERSVAPEPKRGATPTQTVGAELEFFKVQCLDAFKFTESFSPLVRLGGQRAVRRRCVLPGPQPLQSTRDRDRDTLGRTGPLTRFG